jgi:tetratricopeptide (TPR) repeat protein
MMVTRGMVAVTIVALGLILAAIGVCPAPARAQDTQLQQATQLKAQGWTLYQQGRYLDAERLEKRALEMREKALGPNHLAVAASLNDLALVYEAEGRYAEAEPLDKRALAIFEKALGPEHLDVARSLNNLAVVYDDEGRYADAEPLDKRALAILEKALGPEQPDVAKSLNNLARVYEDEGRYADAEPLQKRALAIKEKALGPEHRDVADSLNALALLYEAEGRNAEAEALYKRGLAIDEKALGSEHPYVANSLNNLARVYQAEGRYTDAEPLDKRGLAIYEKALGAEHPYVAWSLNSLAMDYGAEGRYAEAEPLIKRALTINEKALGPEHPVVAKSLNELALLYEAEGRYAAAEPLFKRALAIDEKAFGPQNVTDSLANLAGLFLVERRYAEAEPLCERARTSILDFERRSSGASEEALKGVYQSESAGLPFYALMLANIAREPQLDPHLVPDDAEGRAFVVAEQARGRAAQASLAKAAVRSAAGDPATAALARQVQDFGLQRSAIEKQLDAEYAKPADQQNADRLRNLQQLSHSLDDQLATATDQLYKTFPKYREITAPDPITIPQVQALLRPGEALVSYCTLGDRVLIWLVRPGARFVYRDTPIKRADFDAAAGACAGASRPTSLTMSSTPTRFTRSCWSRSSRISWALRT